MPEHWQDALVGCVVLVAFLYLVAHFGGGLARFRRRRRPDVPVERLLRGSSGTKPARDDDCCR